VKVFGPDGRLIRTIGTGGRARSGPYDPSHMNQPNGVTIDGAGRLWVAETDFLPKRLSVWTLEGKLVNAFYGPPHYGGGGSGDPVDKTRFFYADAGGGMELKLDWEKGTSRPVAVYLRPELDPLRTFLRGDRSESPETPLHLGGRTYLTDAYNTNPTNGVATASLWVLRDGVAKPAANRASAVEVCEAQPESPDSSVDPTEIVQRRGQSVAVAHDSADGPGLGEIPERPIDLAELVIGDAKVVADPAPLPSAIGRLHQREGSQVVG